MALRDYVDSSGNTISLFRIRFETETSDSVSTGTHVSDSTVAFVAVHTTEAPFRYIHDLFFVTSQEVNGRNEIGLDGQALYVVVRKAVEDAILSVIRTLFLVGISLSLTWLGMMMAVSGEAIYIGIVIIGIGLYLAAGALNIIPSVWNWS